MNKKKLIINVLLSIILILSWIAILFVSGILYLMGDLFNFFGNGILVYIVYFTYVLAFVLPIVFRKRISKYLSLITSFVVFTILAVIIVAGVLVGAASYISEFTQQKWNDNAILRIYMLGDLEEKHKIVGKTNDEIADLLGKPTNIVNVPYTAYEYYVGEGIIDPFIYKIVFEDNIAVKTMIEEH